VASGGTSSSTTVAPSGSSGTGSSGAAADTTATTASGLATTGPSHLGRLVEVAGLLVLVGGLAVEVARRRFRHLG
jgi:hypothetical protein